MRGITVCRPTELGPAEIARWRALQRADPRLDNPFLAPEFAVVLSRHRADVRVAVLEDDHQIVGFFPYHRSRLGVGRALGYGVADGQGLVRAAGAAGPGRDLLRRCGLAVYEFDELLAHQVPALGARRAVYQPSPFIDLTAGSEQWLRAKRAVSDTVKAIPRKLRKLGREVGETTFELEPIDRAGLLSTMIRWKARQYRRTGRPNVFAQSWFAATVAELTETAGPDFGVVLAVLSVDGRPVAVEHALAANGVLAHWFPAYDVALSRYSPGMACMLEFVRVAADHGYREICLGKGHADYKETLKDGDHLVATGWAETRSPVATFRRLQTAPTRHLTQFVLTRPTLRRAVRSARRELGRLHTAVRDR